MIQLYEPVSSGFEEEGIYYGTSGYHESIHHHGHQHDGCVFGFDCADVCHQTDSFCGSHEREGNSCRSCPAEEGISSEVIAVIAAAVAAYGYGEAQIQSIRPAERNGWKNSARVQNIFPN